jgi:hypothetical protein
MKLKIGTRDSVDPELTFLSCPYFIGILGERYGWHQTSFNSQNPVQDDLLDLSFQKAVEAGHTWLQNYSDRSVTELEIIHGVLERDRHLQHKVSSDRKDVYCRVSPSDDQIRQQSSQTVSK